MNALIKFAAVLVFSGLTTLSASTIVGNVGDDTAFGNYMNGLGVPGFSNLPTVDYTYEVFAPQGRIGNNSATGGSNEIGLHRNNPADSTPPTNDAPLTPTAGSIQMGWGTPGFTNPTFSLELKRVGITISFRLFDNSNTYYSATFDDPNAANVTLLALRTRAGVGGSTTASRVQLTNLQLTQGVTTTSVPSSVANATSGTAVQNVVVKDLVGDFILTGSTSMDWTGSPLTNSAMAWQIKSFQGVPVADSGVPEPATMGLLAGGGLLMLVAKGFRRS